MSRLEGYFLRPGPGLGLELCGPMSVTRFHSCRGKFECYWLKFVRIYFLLPLKTQCIIRRHRISDSAYCDRCIRASSVCLSVCHSHTRAKAVDGMRCHLTGTFVWPLVTLYYTSPVPPREGKIWGSELTPNCNGQVGI